MLSLKSWLRTAIAAFALALTPAMAQSTFDLGVGSLRVAGSHSTWAILISPTTAIVPAHALGGALSSYSVLFGTKDRTVTNCSTCVVRTLTAAVRHPGFVNNGAQGYPNDIGVIHFASVPYNANIQPVTLAQSTDAAPTVGAPVTGVASTSTANPLLHDVALTVTAVASSTITTTAQPAGETAPGFLGFNGKIHGVDSWGSVGQPLNFTRVSYYYTWIMAN